MPPRTGRLEIAISAGIGRPAATALIARITQAFSAILAFAQHCDARSGAPITFRLDMT
ncbi:hypothetical protein X734_20350 [Mesorhizobium sp. L2C084A000]|nr:hypothetical protein X734_20350 [Mesorhizobium sp. L2C084A000]